MIEDWQKLDPEPAARILSEINPLLEPVPFSEEDTTLRKSALPFYDGYELIELTDMSAVPAARKYAMYKPGEPVVIDWTNQPIYDTNEKSPIALTSRNILDYVRFFFSYVRGRYGRFLIIENVDDIRWQVEPPVQGRKVMQEMLEPLHLVEYDVEEDVYHLEAFMMFKDSLFKTKIHVHSDGLVSMSDEELKIEGMPVLQDSAA
ncbi:MAG: hypothetical protein OXT65_11250 [Alphaproteobacteria bacterium]|nr:hypothetical protein [Alphaproteobacteria bacterium]